MANLLARLTMVRPKPRRGTVLAENLPASAVGGEGGPGIPPAGAASEPIPILINAKALTYPLMVALVKGAWEAAKVLPVPWAASIWVPFTLCMVLVLLVAVSNLTETKANLFGWLFGLFVAGVNGLVVFGAIVGISPNA